MDYRSIARKAGYVTGAIAGTIALFLPGAPKQNSIDAEVMKNLKPGNSQTQQVAHSQPTLDEYIGATTGHTAEKAYAGGAKTPIVDMYDWDGVCRDKNEYYSKVPAANTTSWSAEPENFLKAVYNDDNVFNTLKEHGLIEPIKSIQESKTDYLDRVTITDNFLEFGINSTIDDYSNMRIKGDSRYFVFEQLGERDINKLRPYFE